MTRVAAGDREAIAWLYDHYAAILLPVALRILRSRSDAEDAVHDAFVTLPSRARHFSTERGSVAAWLVILVRNLSIDRTRRRGVRQALAESVEHDSNAPERSYVGPPDPETAIDRASKRARIQRALSALPEAQRITLQTAFFEGLSYPEISERDGVSLGTVKSRAARALSALRLVLGEETLEDDGT